MDESHLAITPQVAGRRLLLSEHTGRSCSMQDCPETQLSMETEDARLREEWPPGGWTNTWTRHHTTDSTALGAWTISSILQGDSEVLIRRESGKKQLWWVHSSYSILTSWLLLRMRKRYKGTSRAKREVLEIHMPRARVAPLIFHPTKKDFATSQFSLLQISRVVELHA